MSGAVTYETTEYGRVWVAPVNFNEVRFGTSPGQFLTINRVRIEVQCSEAHRNSDGTWEFGEKLDYDWAGGVWSIRSRRADWRERGYRHERPSDSAQRKLAAAALAAVRNVARDSARFDALLSAAKAQQRDDEIIVASGQLDRLLEQRDELDREIAHKRELLERLRAA